MNPAVVSIRINGVRDVRSVFHWAFFFVREHDGFQTARSDYIFIRTKPNAEIENKSSEKEERFRSPLIFAPWQRSLTPFSHCPTIPHKEISDSQTPSSILSRPESMRLFLISSIQAEMKGKWLQTIEKIWLVTERKLRKITPVNFQHCNTQWVERWRWRVNAGVEYFGNQ